MTGQADEVRAGARASYKLHDQWGSLEGLIDAHTDPDGGLKLDLGCGYVKPEGSSGWMT